MSLYLFRQGQWQKGQDKVSFTKLLLQEAKLLLWCKLFLSFSKVNHQAHPVLLSFSECVTQNPARLVKRVKELLSKNGARTSPVAFLFEKKGSITLTPNGEEAGYEHLFDLAVEAGAEDVKEMEGEDGGVEFEVNNVPFPLFHSTC